MRRGGAWSWAAAGSLDEAAAVLAKEPEAFLLAGGTDLIPRWKCGLVRPGFLLSLGGIRELEGIRPVREGISVGSMVTLAALAADPLVAPMIPPLAFAARCVASPQIRNVGTVGGNLLQERRCLYFNQSSYWRKSVAPCLKLGGEVCHQIPSAKACCAIYYSDLAPVLWAWDAMVEVRGAGGVERLAVGELLSRHVHGPRRPGILTRIVAPRPAPGSWGAFLKSGKRAAVDFATANVAVRYSPSGADGRGAPEVRVILGAMGPLPVELEETRAFLLENLHSPRELKAEAGRLARQEAQARSRLIRETAVSLPEKRAAAGLVERAVSLLAARLAG